MKITVLLKREFDTEYDLEEFGFKNINEIKSMEDLEAIEDESSEITTWLVSVISIEEDKQ